MSNSYRKYIILIAIISAILGIIVASVLFHSFQLLETKPVLLSQEYRGYTENNHFGKIEYDYLCLLYTSPSPRDTR